MQSKIIIFHGYEVGIEKICLRVTVWHHEALPRDAKQWTRGMYLSAPNNHDRFIFLHTFWSPGFDFNVAVGTNESRSYMLASAILKIEVVYDIVMMSTSNILTTELHDLLYSQCVVIHFLSIPRVG